MAHYAILDKDNVVIKVIVGIDETETIEGKTPETWYSNFLNAQCVRTSFNKKIRKNFAGIGYTYDATRDAFIAPKPNCHPSDITFHENTCCWSCPNSDHEIEHST